MLHPCPREIKRDKGWLYDEYYIGKTDNEKRRNGAGENHWTGAESIEWYNGRFTRDTMNGAGEYRWRYCGPQGAFITYEGWFYANRMHGYGSMSYPDGRVFSGLFYKNNRWGPGIESHTCLRADIGFWRQNQLIRLAWRPPTFSVVLDFMGNTTGRVMIEPYRVMLVEKSKIIGETNTALELLKESGADPFVAGQIWGKLYPTHCTDLESQACHVDVFERDCYGSIIHSLVEAPRVTHQLEAKNEEITESDGLDSKMYYAWNNSEIMLHVMKHCYRHEKQRNSTRVNLKKILNGPRRHYRPAARHEQDCRTLLMASYLGYVINVVKLVNEHNVNPDVSDIQGNTALMYATCGDQADIMHFLVEAGANVNGYNDCCCTPLGVALMRYACANKDIDPKSMVEALMPQITVDSLNQAFEWNISRDLPPIAATVVAHDNPVSATKTTSRLVKPLANRKGAIASSLASKLPQEPGYDSDDSFSEEKRLYHTIGAEYYKRVNNLFIGPNKVVPYIFTVTDMLHNLDEILPKKTEKGAKGEKLEKKSLHNNVKTSKAVLLHGNGTEEFGKPVTSTEKLKIEMLSKMMLTILQLLSDGADPRLVLFPQPALLIAVAAGNADLVRHLVRYGVDVNEKYPGALNYTALEVAISHPLTIENIELVRALLESGAEANHRLHFPDPEEPGPTLLHAVLAAPALSEIEEELQLQILELLLEYECNPGTPFRGRSAIDIVMTNKMHYFNSFIRSPTTHLNDIINSSNQTILVKMLSTTYFKVSCDMDRSVILSHLLLYGADPLIECQDGEEKYGNIFAYAKYQLVQNIEPSGTVPKTKVTMEKDKAAGKNEKGNAKNGKGKEKQSKLEKLTANEINEYKLEIVLMEECARILHIRWLQTKLMKKLLEVIIKYKHRQWNMIIKEHENRKTAGVWLKPQRCLEIWTILKTTRKKLYKDERILKHLLCIVQFYSSKSKHPISPAEISPKLTAIEKRRVEARVAYIMKEHERSSGITDEVQAWRDVYVKPELAIKCDKKFKICFECALPLPDDDDDKIICTLCFVVSFCSFDCVRKNIERINCHPCSEYLRLNYISILEPSDQDIVTV